MSHTKKGKIIVFSAPSGAGKTTIARQVMEHVPNLHFSVSATTRHPRPNEVNGRDYFFLSRDEFLAKVEKNEFVEWEEVFGNYYGTLYSHIEDMMTSGQNVILDIDVKGGLNISSKYGSDALTIFISPPDLETLIDRLKNRATESDETLSKRLERVPMEMDMGKHFQVQIINHDLRIATEEAKQAIEEFIK